MPIAQRTKQRRRTHSLNVMMGWRKVRLALLASMCASHYVFMREMLVDGGLQPSTPGSTEDDDDLVDAAFGHNHMLLMAQFALLLSAAKPHCRKGRTYSVGKERYSFMRIERDMTGTSSCWAHFRFELDELKQLFRLLKFPPIIRTHNATATGEEVFLYMIRRLSYPSTQAVLAMECGRRPCEQSQLFAEALTHVYNTFPHLRDNRSLETYAFLFPHFAARIKCGGRKGPVPLKNCVGYLDGSNQYCSKPGEHQELLYNGHKRRHAVKWQGLQLPNGIMPMPFGPLNGRHHDSFMLNKSGVVRIMRRICRRLGRTYQLYGDPAYPQSGWIGGPFRHQRLTADEAAFNIAMSSTRIVNEWGFGRIKLNWAFLDFENGMKPYLNDMQKFWPVATILMNCHCCLHGSQTAEYFDMLPPSLEEYLTNFGQNV